MQIINLASTRGMCNIEILERKLNVCINSFSPPPPPLIDCDYELHIQLNNVTLATKRGVLRKIEKNVSADRPQEEALAL